MTYSLVSMPVVGFDLCRRPGGVAVADLLLAALELDHTELGVLADRHPGPVHRVRWALVERACLDEVSVSRRLRAVPRAIAGTAGIADAGVAGTTSVIAELERAPIGDLGALVRLTLEEILDWTWMFDIEGNRWVDERTRAAGEVLAEAIAAEYAVDALPAGLAADLRAPFTAAGLVTPASDLGPQGTQVRRVLDRIGRLDADGRDALRAAVERSGDRRMGWAAAVHDASWAVHLTDRVRAAAAAQLLAVQSFAAGGLTAQDGAYGVWNAVSGLVQSLVVSDVLCDRNAALLQWFWVEAFREVPSD